MGSPTYGGLARVQSYFAEKTDFPLPDFRMAISPRERPNYSCGLPVERYFTDGEEGDLSLVATIVPYNETADVALSSLKDGYGIRFVRLHYSCVFGRDTDTPDSMIPRDFVIMEAYGREDFINYVYANRNDLSDLARYGIPHPSFLDRIKMSFTPWWYQFPAMG